MFKKILIVLVLLLLGGAVFGFFWLRSNFDNGRLQEAILQRIVPSTGSPTAAPLLESALGMKEPRTYLVLFLNNTELRPGGGFIGSYAVVKMDKGKPSIEKIEGTEILDNYAKGIGFTAPAPLTKYLKIKKWQFRDSNWSPDFPTDAETALALYSAEHGTAASSISGVVGVTPTLFEQILKIIGPITVDGIEFRSDNFTEKLEYEVEYGYKDRGLSFDDRKKLLTDLSKVLLPKLLTASITHWSDFMRLIPDMIAKKQIMLYSNVLEEETFLTTQGWAGEMQKTDGDYLLWSDANLGALKTDVAINRELTYSVNAGASGIFATASMNYRHTGSYTWRTTKYLDYVRIFVPKGSKLIKIDGSTESIAEGDEQNYHWFGAYFEVLPGRSAALSFTYQLPSQIQEQINNNQYQLKVQKQLGTGANKLTLNLKFDKNLTNAKPPETPDHFGDSVYTMITDLAVDRAFSVNF